MFKKVLVPAAIGLVVPGAYADEEANSNPSIFFDEIVVTAQKREQSLQDVSVAVSAFSGAAIEKMGFEQGLDIIQQVPNMSFFAIFGEASSPSISLRGISLVNFSDSWESPVSMYVDDVYRGNPAGSAISLFDLERIEVLRGPQGTLYGRNTTGGLVHYISKNPTAETEGYASVQYGSFNEIIGEAALSGPINDRIRARVAVKYNNNDGWQTNAVDGKKLNDTNSFGYRGKVEVDLSETATFLLDIHGSTAKQQTVGFAHLGYNDPVTGARCNIATINAGDCISTQLSAFGAQTGRQEAGGKFGPKYVAASGSDGLATEIDTFGVSGKFTLDFDTITLTSITAYEELKKFLQDDGDGTSVIWFDEQYRVDAKQFTQELRLNGQTDTIDWVAGLFYYDDSRDLLTEAPTSADGPIYHREDVTLDSRSWAAFGQVDYHFSEEFTLSGGLRYTEEDRDFTQDSDVSFYTPIVTGVVKDLSDNAVTGRAALEWTPNDDTLVYASFSTGFKSGGFSGSYNASFEATNPVDAENITNYELGFKTTFADGKGRLNMAAFLYELKDFQTQVFVTVADGSIITNAGDVTGYGLEGELAYQISRNFEITAGAGWLDTEFDSDNTFTVAGVEYSLDGNELPSAPEFTYNIVARYYIDLGGSQLALQADYNWQAAHFLQIENDPFSRQESYGIANAKISWSTNNGKHTIDAFVKNLGDENYFTYQNTLGPDWGYAVWGKPRTFGVQYTIKM